jgi:hypothetical protein
MDVYGSVTHNCQNLEAAKKSLCRQMNKLIQPDNTMFFNAKKKQGFKPLKDREKT